MRALAPKGTSTFGYWDGLAGSRRGKSSLMAAKNSQPKGGCPSSDIIEVREGTGNFDYRARYRPEVSVNQFLENVVAVEHPGERDCRLKVLSAWEQREIDEVKLKELLMPYLTHQPYLNKGDRRTTAEVLDAAYDCQITTYNGSIDSTDFRSILIAYSNICAAMIICMHDDTDGRGPGSLKRVLACRTSLDLSAKSVNARQRCKIEAEAGFRLSNSYIGTCEVTREGIRPLKSLKGWRPTATGDYYVALRWHSDHVQPLGILPGARVGRPCNEAEFWGNNNCAEWEHGSGRLAPALRLDCPFVVEAISPAVGNEVLIDIPPERPICNPKRMSLTVCGEAKTIRLESESSRCIERWAHSGQKGFYGPDVCRICKTLKTQAEDYRLFSTVCFTRGNQLTYCVRGSCKTSTQNSGESTQVLVKVGRYDLTLQKVRIKADRAHGQHYVMPSRYLAKGSVDPFLGETITLRSHESISSLGYWQLH